MLSDQEDIAGYIQGADTWHLWRAVHRELRSHRQSPGVFQSFHVKPIVVSWIKSGIELLITGISRGTTRFLLLMAMAV